MFLENYDAWMASVPFDLEICEGGRCVRHLHNCVSNPCLPRYFIDYGYVKGKRNVCAPKNSRSI